MRVPLFASLSALLAQTALAAPAEMPLEAWLEPGAQGGLLLHTRTDVGRGYQLEWSDDLASGTWNPALPQPVEGTGGPQAFYLGSTPGQPSPPPSTPPRLDFTLRAHADGTALAQWRKADSTLVQRRVPLDFRQVPRLAHTVTPGFTIVTRTQLTADPATTGMPPTPDPDPEIQTALQALADAYPQLALESPETPVYAIAGTAALTANRYWRVRRIDWDNDGDGLQDFQEWQTTLTNPLAADSDGDGLSDGVEVAAGSPPLDFFNGARPSLVRLPSRWGDVPFTAPESWLDEPLVLEIRSPDGTPRPGAPVTAAATAGGLDDGNRELAARTPHPVIQLRADGNGRVSLVWRAGALSTPVAHIHAWSGEGMGFQGTHFLVHTVRPLAAPVGSLAAWLRSDQGVTLSGEARVEAWADTARGLTGTAEPNLRPRWITQTPRPEIEFTGTQRLDLGTTLGGPSLSALVVARPSAARDQPPLSSGNPDQRTPGLSGQRYLLAGEVSNDPSPWLYTPPVPRKLETTQYFSRYTALYFVQDPINGFRGYECRAISYTSGQLLPTLPAAQAPTLRYDITPDAVPDPGPALRQRGKTYRLNPGWPDRPLTPGASVTAVMNDFALRRGFPSTYQWEPREFAGYTRRAGNPAVDDFRETYYEAKGYTPAVPEKYELQPGRIGRVGHGLSLGTNSAGYLQLSQSFAPALGSRPSPAGLHLTSLVITNGQAVLYANGSQTAAALPPVGGTGTGIRFLGALNPSTNGYIGTVSDIMLSPDPLTQHTRTQLEDVLAERHRLSSVDRDQDTLPDWWEHRFLAAGTGASPAADTDADGLTTAQERARFTLPEVADSDADGLNDQAESAAAAITPDADSDGFFDGSDPLPNDPANGRQDTQGTGRPDGLSARLAAPDQRDSDQDSLPDFVEMVSTRTNPNRADTDGDSLPDGWESAFALDPNNPAGQDGAQGDPDGDGHTNAEEFAAGTDPQIAN